MASSLTGSERLARMMIRYNKDPELPPWRFLKYITPEDFEHPTHHHPIWLIYLDCLRWEATRLAGRDIKVIVTSDFRKGDADSAHGTDPCVGSDLRIKTSGDRYFLLWAAFNLNIKRIGIYCDDYHLHLDLADIIYGTKPDGNPWPTEVAWVRACK